MNGVRVAGGASAEELAAVLAVLAAAPVSAPGAYARWREARVAAVRPRAEDVRHR
jgi:hypothetical protein